MKKSCFLALIVLTAASGAFAADKAKDSDASDKDKVICRTEKVTGSRTRVNRICMTREQWDLQAANTKKGLDEMGRNAAGGANSSFNPANAPGVQ